MIRTKILSDCRAVPHDEYDEKYFLTDCGGYSNFIEYQGLKIDDRMAISLKLANIRSGMSILDLGSGRGEIVLHCALRKARSIGIDYSYDAIKLAIGLRSKYTTIEDNMSFLRGSVVRLPIKNITFDRIFLLDIVEHLYDYELDDLFKNLNRMLKEDGIIVIHTSPNKLYYECGYKIIRAILYIFTGTKIEKDIRTNYEKSMHINEQTQKSLFVLLNKHGFDSKIRLLDNCHPVALIKKHISYNPLSKLILSIINWHHLSRIFCKDIYAVATKDAKYLPDTLENMENNYNLEYVPCSRYDLVKDMITDSIIMGKNDIGTIGNGWYDREDWPPIIRWTCRESIAYLENDKNCKYIKIKFFTNVELEIRIYVNNVLLKKVRSEKDKWQILEEGISNTGLLELKIELDKVWIPDEILKNGDTRNLGIAINKIWLE